jgi:hypothetical protein
MSYTFSGWTYDPNRKLNSLTQQVRRDTTTGYSTLQNTGVPYNLQFNLSVYSRNLDDGLAVVEQIIAYFRPDITISMVPVAEIGIVKDIPVVLEGISQDFEFEGAYDSTRILTWNLSFTMAVEYYGPTYSTDPTQANSNGLNNIYGYKPIIRKVIASEFEYVDGPGSDIWIKVGGGNGTYLLESVVYQGSSYGVATAIGVVQNWVPNSNILHIQVSTGPFKTNNVLRSLETRANYNVAALSSDPIYADDFQDYNTPAEVITVTPDPIDANPGDDYGYTVEITEAP